MLKRLCWKDMNCKLKLHSKGLYWQIFGAVPVLNFLQTLAVDLCLFVCYFSREILVGRKKTVYRQMYTIFWKLVLRHVAACNALNFFSRILRREALVYNSYFFSEQPFHGNYSSLDSLYRNTIISRTVAYSSRWLLVSKICPVMQEHFLWPLFRLLSGCPP